MNKVEITGPCSGPVVIVGAGASGVLSATALLRAGHRSVVLVERDRSWSTGPAYSTTDVRHLLNVPAGKLSADSTRPCDFVEWAAGRVPGVTAESFLPRRLFGQYLREALEDAANAADAERPGALTRITAEAIGLDRSCSHSRDPARVRVVLRDWGSIDAARVVLALGNPPSRALTGDTDAVIDDPWSVASSPLIGADDSVVIVGTRLTAVDVALSLAGRGHRGPISMVSRTGALSRPHDVRPARMRPVSEPLFAPTARAAVAWFRTAVAEAGGDWRSVFDAIRPRTNEIWSGLPECERARLLRHVIRYWELHRHRMAPEVSDAVEGLVRAGRVELVAGVVTGVERGPHATRRVIVRDALGACSTIDTKWVVNCTGANFDLRGSTSPLVRSLFDRGLARPGPLGLGFDVTPDGSLIDRAGRVSPTVTVVGPLRRGSEWETTAVPEIRGHAEALAGRLPAEPLLSV